jgi:hypothetical protein
VSASPASICRERLVVSALALVAAACGARDGLPFRDVGSGPISRNPPGSGGRGSVDGPTAERDSGVTRLLEDARVAAEGDATPPREPRDAGNESLPEAALDAEFDGPSVPDCTCPDGDYFVDAIVGGVHQRFTAPYELFLYCQETAVQLVHTSCSDLYSLSACTGPNYGPPCLYVVVDLTRGPLIGHYFESTGQTGELLAGSIQLEPASGRIATGTFQATFANPRDGGLLPASGSFRACVPRMPACRS